MMQNIYDKHRPTAIEFRTHSNHCAWLTLLYVVDRREKLLVVSGGQTNELEDSSAADDQPPTVRPPIWERELQLLQRNGLEICECTRLPVEIIQDSLFLAKGGAKKQHLP